MPFIHISSCQNCTFARPGRWILPPPSYHLLLEISHFHDQDIEPSNNCRVWAVVNERLARRQWMTLLLMMTLIIGTRNYYVGSGTRNLEIMPSQLHTTLNTMIINGSGWSFCFKVWRSAGDKMPRLRLWVTSFVITRSRTWPGSQSGLTQTLRGLK